MKLDWDFSELTKFTANLQNTYNLQTSMMAIAKRVAQVLHQNLLNLTPIKTGNLRKMWSAGENLKFTVKKVGNGFEVTFINTARTDKGFQYGLAVNDGHRTPSGGGWVMGRFFVEKAIIQTANSAQIEQLIMSELQKWWRSV